MEKRQVISRKHNSLKIGEIINIEKKEYKVVGISLFVNRNGGTDYVIEELPKKSVFQKILNKIKQ